MLEIAVRPKTDRPNSQLSRRLEGPTRQMRTLHSEQHVWTKVTARSEDRRLVMRGPLGDDDPLKYLFDPSDPTRKEMFLVYFLHHPAF
jgi:hypothetical protein